MPTIRRSVLTAALVLAPAGAFAQGLVNLAPVQPPVVIEEPVVVQEPVIVQEPAVVVEEPIIIQQGPVSEDQAVAIARLNGLVAVREVNRTWRGNFEVEGTDRSGEDIEVYVEAETGAVLDIDD